MTMNGDQLTSAAVTDRGLNDSRPHNEDSYLELKQHGLFVVADGVGGAQAGDVASQMAVEIIGEAFVNLRNDADPEDTMRVAIERANGAIYQMSRDLPQLSSMATTVVALHVAGEIATLAHVGDSRIYRVDASGRLYRETDDHSVVEEEVRAGRMTPQQALVHPSRNVISRALGAEEAVAADIKMQIVHPATTFLLCSDGITRHIDDSEIESLLASDSEPTAICEKMKEICYGRGAEDNLTAVVVKFPGDRQPRPADSGEDEQITVATARSPFDSIAEVEDRFEASETVNIAEELEAEEAAEINTESAGKADLSPLDQHDDGAYLFEDPEELFEDKETGRPAPEYTSSSVMVPAQKELKPEASPGDVALNYDDVKPAGEKGSLSKAAAAAALVIAGVLLGMAGMYFLTPPPPPPAITDAPVLTEQKSNNVPLTAFEEGRRLVDAEPAKYIALNPTPQVAEDYFLLARAFMLTGKYWDAKRFYGMAKDRLSLADDKNSRIMSTEIAMALAIIESPKATEVFANQIAAGAAAPATGDANANAPAGAGQPIR